MVEKGDIEPLMKTESKWTCLSCFACVERCPRSVEPAKLIEAVRLAVIRQQGANHLKPQDIPTLRAAAERGLLPDNPKEISIFGDLSKFVISDFKTIPAQQNVFYKVLGGGFFGKIADFFVARVITPFPKLEASACIGCGKCAQICPAKAITMEKGKPQINRSVCIHCFCCQEFCPKGAMRQGRHMGMEILRNWKKQ